MSAEKSRKLTLDEIKVLKKATDVILSQYRDFMIGALESDGDVEGTLSQILSGLLSSGYVFSWESIILGMLGEEFPDAGDQQVCRFILKQQIKSYLFTWLQSDCDFWKLHSGTTVDVDSYPESDQKLKNISDDDLTNQVAGILGKKGI